MHLLQASVAAVALALLGAAAGADSGVVVQTGTMSVPRAVHTATALGGGDVLVVGGCSSRGCELGSGSAKLAELYDRRTGRFVPAGALREWRDDHVASRLPDGRVLVAGGWGVGGVLVSTELYDPVSKRFFPGPVLHSPRAGATATVLHDGRVLVAGGFTNNKETVATAEVFIPGAGAFREVGPMNVPRGAHSAALLRDGRVLMVGGLSRGQVVATAEIFDPLTGRFDQGPAMRTARYKAAAITLRDGRVLVVGGSGDIEGRRRFATTELYDPAQNRFRDGPRMKTARYKINGAAALLANGNVLVAGGGETAEVLDVPTLRFRTVAGRLGGARAFLTATPLPGGKVLLAGGYDSGIVPTARAWRYRYR